MSDRVDSRLETACRCLDLPRPSRDEWLVMSDEECIALSSLMSSLSDPIRIRIVEMLSKGPLYVCIIQHFLSGIKYSKLSYHLNILRKADIIGSKREGNYILFSLTPRGRNIVKDLPSLLKW